MSVGGSSSVPSPPSLPRYLLLVLLLPSLLVGFGVWLDGEYGRMRETAALMDQIATRRIHALNLISNLRKAETAQRGFVITRNPEFLQSYEPSRHTANENLAVLGTPMSEPDQLGERARILKALISAKYKEMDQVLALVRAGEQARALAQVSQGRGQHLMDRIEAELQVIIAADAAHLTAVRSLFWERTLRSRQIVWIVIVTLIALLLLGTVLLWLSRRERWRVEIAEADASVRNRTVLDSTSDAIVILNPSGTIENVNAAARTVLGYEPAELSRRDVSVVIDIADGDGSFHERIGLVEGKLRRTLFVDRFARTKDGRTVPVDVGLGLMAVPDGLHVVASIRDISHRREIEQIKDDFIATVSHELRTPLTSVVGSLGLLRGGAAGVLPSAARQLVEIAENNARRLIRLTNDILDLEKFGSGQMTLELAHADLTDVVRQAVLENEVPAAAKSVTLRIMAPEEPLSVMADRQRLLQVATNLLSNAIRHTPEHSTVTVTTQVSDGKALVRISDQGAGVPEAYREHIFDRFVQAPMQGAPVGTGLGLAIAREIIARHGGNIWVEEAPGGGASFAFTLSRRRDPALLDQSSDVVRSGQAALTAKSHADERVPTILQIDDDVDLVEVVAAALTGEARVIGAHDLASARAVLEHGRPDLVLLDIGLPDGSGLDILPLLTDRSGRQLPIIVFSAQVSPAELSGRVEAVLVKSRSSIPTLRATIRRILAEQSATQGAER